MERHSRLLLAGACALPLLSACSDPGGRDLDAVSSVGTTPSGDTSSGDPTAADASTGAASGGSSGDGWADLDPPKFDVGWPDAGYVPPAEDGCQKVDFLFVIDNSGSMANAQKSLVDNFPAFIDGIESTLGDSNSYHVGVVTTDSSFNNAPGCDTMGGLVVKTAGSQSSESTCGPYAAGNNFMTDEDDLAAAFSCAARVGIGGEAYERPIVAMRTVLDGSLAGPGQCNEGFLRDDALLVTVIITDEAEGEGDPEAVWEDGTSPGTPAQWFDAVVAAKGGIPDNAVVLTLNNYEGGACPPKGQAFDGSNLKAFTQMFTYGFMGGICEPDYGPIFSQAVDVIQNACENFTPPG